MLSFARLIYDTVELDNGPELHVVAERFEMSHVFTCGAGRIALIEVTVAQVSVALVGLEQV